MSLINRRQSVAHQPRLDKPGRHRPEGGRRLPRRTGHPARPGSGGAGGRAARRSRANVRHPRPRRLGRRAHSPLTACPRPRLAGHGRWRGGDAPSALAASLASSAALLGPAQAALGQGRLGPTSFPTRSGALRAIDSTARPRLGPAFGRRRLRRQSQRAVVATQSRLTPSLLAPMDLATDTSHHSRRGSRVRHPRRRAVPPSDCPTCPVARSAGWPGRRQA